MGIINWKFAVNGKKVTKRIRKRRRASGNYKGVCAKGWSSYRVRGVLGTLNELAVDENLSAAVKKELVVCIPYLMKVVAVLDEERKMNEIGDKICTKK